MAEGAGDCITALTVLVGRPCAASPLASHAADGAAVPGTHRRRGAAHEHGTRWCQAQAGSGACGGTPWHPTAAAGLSRGLNSNLRAALPF